VVCGHAAKDAHHLYERRLWGGEYSGGYITENGVSLCAQCHLDAEATTWSVQELAEMAGILRPPLPPILESGHIYDKWGNLILPDGTRMIGPLYYDSGVQKILKPLIDKGTFTDYIKYPRTPHLAWSAGGEADEMVLEQTYFQPSQDVVVTEKMDGENMTVYNDKIHARSIDSGYHASRTWVKNFAAKWQGNLGHEERVCGENMYAVHSLKYDELPSYFLGFSFWTGRWCQSWDRTLELFEILGVTPVPVLYEGTWDQTTRWIQGYHANPLNDQVREGYVVRSRDEFALDEFRQSVAKYVRPNHVTSDAHWRHNKLDKNGLAG